MSSSLRCFIPLLPVQKQLQWVPRDPLGMAWGVKCQKASAPNSEVGKTAWDCARERGHKDVVTLLEHKDWHELRPPRSKSHLVEYQGSRPFLRNTFSIFPC